MGFSTQWRGQKDTQRWRFRLLVLASVLLHLPLSPVGGVFGLIRLVSSPAEGPADLNAISAIPVELVGEGQLAPAAEPESVAAPSEPAPPPEDDPYAKLLEETDSLMDLPEPEDAGAAEPSENDADAGPDAGPADASLDAEPESVADAEAPGDAGAEGGVVGIPDPVAMAGAAGQVANANANVRLILYMDRIRRHPVGNRVRELLKNTWQWQDFFGTGGIDPLQDVDRILIAGPQLRDSSDVVAVVRHNVSASKIRGAVDRLVKRDRTGGAWLDAGVPAAEASADGASRVFVMPNSNLMVVAPPSARTSALGLSPTVHFPPPRGNEAVSAYLVTPWRALRGIRFSVPVSVKWARVSITETANSGALARIEAEDESADAARATASRMQQGLRWFVTLDFIEHVSFSSQGTKIIGEVEATREQIAALLELARQQQEQWMKKRAQAQREQKEKAERAAKKKEERAPATGSKLPDAGTRDAGVRVRKPSAPAASSSARPR